VETELFDWESWDELDYAAIQCYNTTLKCDIGPYKVGDKFDAISVDFSRGFLEFYRNNKSLGAYRISLQVGDKITDQVGS
jgi:hypothetical protein